MSLKRLHNKSGKIINIRQPDKANKSNKGVLNKYITIKNKRNNKETKNNMLFDTVNRNGIY